jgi:Membrane bound hydrogenase subunit mbhF
MNKGMSEIVKTICRIVSPFILIFGISIVIYGHLTPGGGFQVELLLLLPLSLIFLLMEGRRSF